MCNGNIIPVVFVFGETKFKRKLFCVANRYYGLLELSCLDNQGNLMKNLNKDYGMEDINYKRCIWVVMFVSLNNISMFESWIDIVIYLKMSSNHIFYMTSLPIL